MRAIHALHVRTAPLAPKANAYLARSIRPVLGFAAILLGCGCSVDPSSSWVGLYEVEGEQVTVCGTSSKTTSLSGTATLGYGVSAGVFLSSIGSCALQWNATDTTATLEPGQSCSLSVDGSMTSVAFSSGLATNDSIVSMTFEGSADNGCKVTRHATLIYVPIRMCKKSLCGYIYPDAG
jgi:hypothetical protein